MKTHFLTVLFFGVLLAALSLTSCTSEKGQIQKKALEISQLRFEESVRNDANRALKQSEWLANAYVHFMTSQSKVNVGEVQFQGTQTALIKVSLRTYSPEIQQKLLAIAGRLEASKVRNFNFPDAATMIAQQVGEKNPQRETAFGALQFTKNSSGEWVPQQ